ncbi:MAG: ATP-dependent DNA helicase RecG [Pirellulales bacterium]
MATMTDSKRNDSPLDTPLQFFPGVGPERAALLEKLQIDRPIDLLFYFPRAYQNVAPIKDASGLEADVLSSVVGKIEAIDLRSYEDGRTSLGALLDIGGGFVRLVWFNQPFRRHQLVRGTRLIATGIPKSTGISWQMRHPEIQVLDADAPMPTMKPIPIYGLTEGLQQKHLYKMVEHALEKLSSLIPDVLPESFRRDHELLDIHEALKKIHQPETMEEAKAARRRFIFQELLIYQLALGMRRSQLRKGPPAPSLPPSVLIDQRILRRFPFELTGDQQKAIQDVGADMGLTVPMNRLIQGDVGSGKTVIALYAMLLAVAHRYQAALMAPTEVLARQHASRLQQGLQGSQVHVELLTGSLGQRDRRELMERIALGTVDIVVGTQALLSEHVEFAKLGLIVIDEQHKFGVMQRAALRGAKSQPHCLILSATPIPRTLTMTLFGDLDVSLLKEKPAGRAVVHTYLGQKSQQDSWWSFVSKQVQQGRQAYVIAPRVDQEEEDDLHGAEQLFETLQQGPLSHLRLGLLHGRMDGETKQQVLDRFNDGEIDVLVATTVVEVGIDVPNATVMTILDADRLGLAQLHQLRGRISRGSFPGYLCVFASGDASPDDNARLQALASTEDGFQLAELDLKMRGPGNLLGTRQHGLPPFRIADLQRDTEILEESRQAAQAIMARDPEFADPSWSKVLHQVQGKHGEMLSLADVG